MKFLKVNEHRRTAFPFSSPARENTMHRAVSDLEKVTAAQIIGRFRCSGLMVFLGFGNKAVPFVRQLAPYVVVGSERVLKDSAFNMLPLVWSESSLPASIPAGSGMICLRREDYNTNLKDAMAEWAYDHHIVLCLGGGVLIDSELLSLLPAGSMVASENLARDCRQNGEDAITPEILLRSADAVIAASPGSAAKDLVTILPSYEKVVAADNADVSFHQRHSGIRFGQGRSFHEAPVLNETELLQLEDNGRTVIWEARRQSVSVATVVC